MSRASVASLGLDSVMALVVFRLLLLNIGMVERGGGFGLALESFSDAVIRNEMSRQELEGDQAFELGVFGPINDTHAAFAELVGDAVVRDGLADHPKRRLKGATRRPVSGLAAARLYPKGRSAARSLTLHTK